MKAHILVADVLGFSEIVTNLNHRDLDERMDTWVNLVEELCNKTEIEKVQLISDTIFVKEEDTPEGLARLLQFSRRLLERSLERHLPMRGAITNGELTWGKLTYGKALNRAHELERQQEWIGVACDLELESVPWSWDLVCCYPVPMKKGLFDRIPAVVWDIPDRQELVRRCTKQDLLPADKRFRWELHAKLNNTFVYSRYLQSPGRKDGDPKWYDKFWGDSLI